MDKKLRIRPCCHYFAAEGEELVDVPASGMIAPGSGAITARRTNPHYLGPEC